MKRSLICLLAVSFWLFGFKRDTGFVIRKWTDHGESVRLVLIGDTGQLPVENNPHKMSALQRQQLRSSLAAEQATAIIDLGDLFYWRGPKCGPKATPEHSGNQLDAHLYDHVGGLDSPVFLVLGNHDVGPLPEYFKKLFLGKRSGKRSPSRERCYRLQENLHDDIIFPAISYGVDFGPVRLAVLHTSAPQKQWADEQIADFLGNNSGDWSLLAGHHVLRTGCDKLREDVVAPWLKETQIKPDLYLNGHAHILQLGVFDGVPAVTSGSGSKLREFPNCEPTETPGVRWGASEYGYAVLDVSPEQLRVQFKDLHGRALHCWQRDRNDPEGTACE